MNISCTILNINREATIGAYSKSLFSKVVSPTGGITYKFRRYHIRQLEVISIADVFDPRIGYKAVSPRAIAAYSVHRSLEVGVQVAVIRIPVPENHYTFRIGHKGWHHTRL